MGLAVNDERLARRVGAALLLVVAVAAVAVVTLDGVHLRAGSTVHVYFSHTGSVSEGADFQVAGRAIGEVVNIRLVTEAQAAAPDHPLHPEGGVVADIRVEDRYLWMTMKNGEVFVSSRGLIGIGFLEMGAPAGGAAPAEPLRHGDELRGVDPPRMDRVLLRSYQNLMISKTFLAEVAPEGRKLMRAAAALADTLEGVEPTPGAFAELAASMGQLGRDVDRVADKWAAGDVDLADLDRLATRAAATMDRAEAAFGDLERRLDALRADLVRLEHAIPTNMMARFDEALTMTRGSLAKLERIRATIDEMLAMVARGEGNIGGLTNDPEFSDYAKKIGKALKRTPWQIFGTDRRAPSGTAPRRGPTAGGRK